MFSDVLGGVWKVVLICVKDWGFGSWLSESGDDVIVVVKSGGLKVWGL